LHKISARSRRVNFAHVAKGRGGGVASVDCNRGDSMILGLSFPDSDNAHPHAVISLIGIASVIDGASSTA
jgi:hypothetical protein